MTSNSTESATLSAICQANWFWQSFDLIEIERVKTSSGVLTEQVAKRIASQYVVERTLPVDSYERIVETINALAIAFGRSTLIERAELCLVAAEELRSLVPTEPQKRRKLPKSAVSKLVWFVRPENWTMYDSYAARGVGLPDHAAERKKFLTYYKALDEAEFCLTLQRIRQVLVGHGFGSLLAERIVDWVLMERGGRKNPSDGASWVRAYLATRSPTESRSLISAAEELFETLEAFQPKIS